MTTETSAMTQPRFLVAGLGEVLWDKFPDATRLGGAPANFAFHATQLGARGTIVSRVGPDADGERLVSQLGSTGLSIEHIQRDTTHPTGSVRVSLKDSQPAYTITESVAWDFIEWNPDLASLAAECDAVCFGSLARRSPVSRATIERFLVETKPDAIRLFDVNLRQHYFSHDSLAAGFRLASALKLNCDELQTISSLFGWPEDPSAAIRLILEEFPIRLVALTSGAQGCRLFLKDETVHSAPPAIQCADAVGAGDAFAAALVMGMLRNRPLAQIADTANRIGAFVASRPGAMPRLPVELARSGFS